MVTGMDQITISFHGTVGGPPLTVWPSASASALPVVGDMLHFQGTILRVTSRIWRHNGLVECYVGTETQTVAAPRVGDHARS
jgi:hypothetical protein